MDSQALQDYLHRHIPLTRTMQVEVLDAEPDAVRLAAPLAPNINHRDTVFGGSASAVAIVAAWALLYVRFDNLGIDARVVIHANAMRYDRPMPGAFTAVAEAPEPLVWDRFMRTLKRHRRARIALTSTLFYNGAPAGGMSGEFVAIHPEFESPPD